MKHALSRFAELTRDWRVRTLLPVVVIHVAAFAILYVLMYHLAVSNLVKTRKHGAEIILNQLESDFYILMPNHSAAVMARRIASQAKLHNLVALTVYDKTGRPVIGLNPPPTEVLIRQSDKVLQPNRERTDWYRDMSAGLRLYGVRAIENGDACQTCHGPEAEHLGAIQLGIDVSGPVAAATAGIQKKFLLVGAAWIGLVVVMSFIRGVVIGRPLAKIRASISGFGAGAAGGEKHGDLEALADRLHGTIWEMIRSQRQREADIATQMVRAERLAALGELAAGLTHEIKNPLAGVAAALELLKSEDGGLGAHTEVADQMLAELKRVTGTVDSLLRLARPQPPQRTDVDMGKLVREVVSLFSARSRKHGVGVTVEIATDLPLLKLDSGLIVQLLINLLTNALQACDRGGTMKVQAAAFPRGDGVLVAVSDTGRGIPPEALDKVFDPFFTTKEEGTGLGLAICRQIVEQHGGAINIESEAGKGTRVIVLLPGEQEFGQGEGDGAAAAG
jgi:signal transduction histidine kinase